MCSTSPIQLVTLGLQVLRSPLKKSMRLPRFVDCCPSQRSSQRAVLRVSLFPDRRAQTRRTLTTEMAVVRDLLGAARGMLNITPIRYNVHPNRTMFYTWEPSHSVPYFPRSWPP